MVTSAGRHAPLLGIRRLSGRFPTRSNVFTGHFSGHIISTMGSVSFRVCPNRAFNLINRSNYNGSAANHAVVHLAGPATNGIFFRNGSITRVDGRRVGSVHHRVRFVFRSPCTSLGPHVAVKRVISRPVAVRNINAGRRHVRHIHRLLSIIKLGPRRVGHCPRRFSNNRHRHINVTHTFTLGPGLVVYSRPISTLSMSVRTRILGLLGRLRSGFNATCLFVTRSLSIIRRVSSHITIVCLNGVIRISS